ncbi:MAG: helix-turn-helix transcriptional regulator [Sinobacteraceae bacterium]|nr:helix-turn-helix transcriptional regulator [Nevskiaceae bacterium]
MKVTGIGKYQVLGTCRRVSPVLSRLGDKWTVLVITALRENPRRFNEIKRMVDGISQQMLTRTLKSLERDGAVRRTIFSTNPPQVRYELTEFGRSLSVPLLALGQWVVDHLDEIERSQRRFDQKTRSSTVMV